MLLESSKIPHGRINHQFFLDLYLSYLAESSETLCLSDGSISDENCVIFLIFSTPKTDSKTAFYTKVFVVTNLISNLPNRLSWVYFHVLCTILIANPLVKKLIICRITQHAWNTSDNGKTVSLMHNLTGPNLCSILN